MNAVKATASASRKRRLVGLTIAAVGLLASAAIVMPRYRTEIATVDGTHRWLSDIAPVRREFVWQPAEAIESLEDLPAKLNPKERPAVAERGDVIYFSAKLDQEHDDLVYSRRVNGKWSEPTRVPVINSPGDDRGPVINQRGDRLYFCSDRTGGFGGTDLYVCVRKGDQWSRPSNLGTTVNTPADECDLTITDDELRIIFASNRGESEWNPKRDQWTVTLPSDWRNHSFDLYQSDRVDAQQVWNIASPIDLYNTLRHDERSPSLAPDGMHLWFASNRPDVSDSSTDFDLFRGRLTRQDLPVERLGDEINTAADEFAPTLFNHGFELQFSRLDASGSLSGTLLHSVAKEVELNSNWDHTRLDAFLSFLAWLTSRFFDHFAFIVFAIAACYFVAWLTRRLATRELAIPGFLILALLLHVMLITGSFFVFFQQSITRRFKQLFIEEPVVATQVLVDSSATSLTEPSPLDRLSELPEPMPMPTPVADMARQTLAPLESQAIEQALPIPMKMPAQFPDAKLSGASQREMVVASLPVQVPAVEATPALARAVPRRSDVIDAVAFESTRAVEKALMQAIVEPAVQVDRTSDAPQLANVEIQQPAFDRARPQPTAKASDSLDAKVPELAEAIAKSALNLARRTPDVAERNQSDSPIGSLESVASVEPPIAVMFASPIVDVRPTPQDKMLSIPQSQSPTLQAESRGKIAGAVLERPESLPGMQESSSLSGKSQLALSRAAPIARSETVNGEIKPESVVIAKESPEQSVAPMLLAMNVPRQVNDAPQAVDMAAAALKLTGSTREMPRATGVLERSVTTSTVRPLDQAASKGVAAALTRKVSKTPSYADTRINLQSLLLRRKLDDQTKQEVVDEFGGNDQTLATIKRGLSWIERHQAVDGHWGLHNFSEQCTDHPRCTGHGNTRSDTAATALALLPFLGDGHTHQNGEHKDVVARGIDWLVKQQKADGNLFPGNDALAMMYSHGIATIALCECYGMTADPALREPSQKAIDFIVASQDPGTGGWRYQPRNGADTSVVGWQVMALKSAQMAGLTVPEKTLQEAQRWLMSVAGKNDRAGQYAYQGSQYNPAMSAEAMLCLEYLDHARDSEALLQSAAYLQKNLPQRGRDTSYYWYYGTQAMFHLQGEPWRQWNQAIHPLLVETQIKDGEMAGTWDPKDQWENSGGRIYGTSLRLLMLEVYYRHLPIYQAF